MRERREGREEEKIIEMERSGLKLTPDDEGRINAEL